VANELIHTSYGGVLDQSEYENILAHQFNSQAEGDTLYASSSTQLSRLAVGSTNAVYRVSGGVPSWSTTLAGLTLTTPTISSLANATHNHSNAAGGGATLLNTTLTTPSIGSFTNATHNHTNDAGGGATLTAPTISGSTLSGTHSSSSATLSGSFAGTPTFSGVVEFSAGLTVGGADLIIGAGARAEILLGGTDGEVAAGEHGLIETGGNMHMSSAGSMLFEIDNDASATDNLFEWEVDAAGGGGTNLMSLDDAGQLALPVVGANAGILIGGDVLLYRNATNSLTLNSGDTLIAAITPTIGSTAWGAATHAHAASNSGGTIAHSATSGRGANDHHNQAHTVASHSDTTATGAETETLTDGSDASSLHVHTVVSLDTTATGAELTELTDSSETTLHSHSGGAGGFTTVEKTADETVNNSTTLQDDNHLTFSIAADKRYAFFGTFYHKSHGSADLKVQMSVPGTSTMNGSGMLNGATGIWSFYDESTAFTWATYNDERAYSWMGTIIADGSGGTVVVKWAQASAHASDSKLLTGSWIAYKLLN
jgi:hypothetical protein